MIELSQNTLMLVAELVAFNTVATPMLVSLVTKAHWDARLKSAIAFVACALTGVLAVLAGGSIANVAVALPVAVGAMELSYQKYWKATGLAPWIGQLTDRSGANDVGV